MIPPSLLLYMPYPILFPTTEDHSKSKAKSISSPLTPPERIETSQNALSTTFLPSLYSSH
jgi:hypothetical protein